MKHLAGRVRDVGTSFPGFDVTDVMSFLQYRSLFNTLQAIYSRLSNPRLCLVNITSNHFERSRGHCAPSIRSTIPRFQLVTHRFIAFAFTLRGNCPLIQASTLVKRTHRICFDGRWAHRDHTQLARAIARPALNSGRNRVISPY